MSTRNDYCRGVTVAVASQAGYYPRWYVRMLDQGGGVAAAKRLLADPDWQYGLDRLRGLGLLRISVENGVLLSKYAPQFTADERAEARRRLELLSGGPWQPVDPRVTVS